LVYNTNSKPAAALDFANALAAAYQQNHQIRLSSTNINTIMYYFIPSR
jgi:hypothetical protein